MPAASADTPPTLIQRLLVRMREGERGSLVLDILIGMAIFALVAVIAVSAVGQYRMRAYIQAAMSDAEQTANAVAAWITDNASLAEVTYPTGPLTADDLTELEVTPTSSGSHTSQVTVLGNEVDPREYIVCVEYRGAFAEYESGRGMVASGSIEAEGYEGCDATPDPTDDPTDDPTAAPTENPGPTGEPTPTPTDDPTPTDPEPTEEPTPDPVDEEYEVVSLDYKGDLLPSADSGVRGVSDDGQWVLFHHISSPVAEGVPGHNRSFLRNRVTGEVTVFDRYLTNGAPGTGLMYQATMTPSASHIAFAYHGSDLMTGASTPTPLLYVWERETNTLDRIEAPDGTRLLDFGVSLNRLDISDDGRYVSFMADSPKVTGLPSTPGKRMIRHDRTLGTFDLIDHAPDGSGANSSTLHNTGMTLDLSPNGQHAVFTSTATNLDPRATAGRIQVFAWHANTDQVELVSINASGTEANYKQSGTDAFISDDGRYVTWTAQGFQMTNYSTDGYSAVLTRDLVMGTNTIVSRNGNGTTARSSRVFGMTGDGQTVLYWSPMSGIVSNKAAHSGLETHLYLWSRADAKNRSVDKRSTDPGNPYARMSGNARFVAFEAVDSADYPDAQGNARNDVILWNAAVSERLWPMP